VPRLHGFISLRTRFSRAAHDTTRKKSFKHFLKPLEIPSNATDTRKVAKNAKASRSKSSNRAGSHCSDLGLLLADLRRAKGLSLREVEEATGKAVSNAYLSQLENGRINKPSPNVLHSLAEVYAVPYEALMEKAGYLMPSEGRRRRTPLAAFAIGDLTVGEEEELLKYLAFLRSRTPSPARGRVRKERRDG